LAFGQRGYRCQGGAQLAVSLDDGRRFDTRWRLELVVELFEGFAFLAG
jgi:hypothetical protein